MRHARLDPVQIQPSSATILQAGQGPTPHRQNPSAEIGAAVRVLRNLPRLMLDDLSRAPDHVRRPCEAALAVLAAQADRIDSALRRAGELSLLADPNSPAPDLTALAAMICSSRGLKRDHAITCVVEAPNVGIPARWFTALLEGLIDLGFDAHSKVPGSGIALRVLKAPDALRLSLICDRGTTFTPKDFHGQGAGSAAAHLWWLAHEMKADLELGKGPGGIGNRVTLALRLDGRGCTICNGQPEQAAI